MDYDVIVVGAGASGLTAAIAAARLGSSVLVIEGKEKAGKKILATGNGRCNFTNLVQQPECYRSDDSAFAMKVLSCFDVNQTLDFFKELGIYPKNKDGYLYPNSEQASSVVQVLLMECQRLKVHFLYYGTVIAVKKPDYTVVTKVTIPEEKGKNKKAVTSKTRESEEIYQCKKLILATGGCASPSLGSHGSGYNLAKAFGHRIIKPLPALVQLKSSEKYCKTISGVRSGAKVSVFAKEKEIAVEEGEILFTDYGISGIPILQVSRYVAKAIDRGEKVHLILDFMPELSLDKLFELLQERRNYNKDKNLEEMMVGLLNHKLSYVLINVARLDVYKKLCLITEVELKALVNTIKGFKMIITETNSFDHAQVSAGGVLTKEIQETTMESKLSKGLYLTGELVDVDGTCGGYNLQWAWSSGYLAGTAAGRK